MWFISGVLQLQGADRFRARAYENASAVISQYPKELRELFDQHYDLEEIPGIGKTLAEKLTELFTTGTVKAFEKYVAEIPTGTFPLWQLHGVGIKKAYRLAVTFDLNDAATAVAEVKKRAQNHEIRLLDGFGEKSETELITIIDQHHQARRMPYMVASQAAATLISELKACKAIVKIEALGSLRRKTATVGDIDLGIATTNIGLVEDFVKNMKNVKRLVVSGPQLLRLHLDTGLQVDIKVSNQKEWGAFLQHFTGSKEHNIKLREFSLRHGLSLSEHGIKNTSSGKVHTFEDEVSFYAFLGLNWIAPEERLGGSEIEQALKS